MVSRFAGFTRAAAAFTCTRSAACTSCGLAAASRVSGGRARSSAIRCAAAGRDRRRFAGVPLSLATRGCAEVARDGFRGVPLSLLDAVLRDSTLLSTAFARCTGGSRMASFAAAGGSRNGRAARFGEACLAAGRAVDSRFCISSMLRLSCEMIRCFSVGIATASIGVTTLLSAFGIVVAAVAAVGAFALTVALRTAASAWR